MRPHADPADAAPRLDPSPRWWERFYDDLLARVYFDHDDPAELEATLDYLERKLELAPGARVFDQCCGQGRLAIGLAQRGYGVFGVDQAEGYVREGQRRAEARGARLELAVGDAFRFVPNERCHGAFNWWTSFGYADSDEQNLAMLERASEALLPGGRFVLDTMNAAQVVRGFVPHDETEVALGDATLRLVRDSRLLDGDRVLHKRWRYELPDGNAVEHETEVRLYTRAELEVLMARAGFVELEFDGDCRGTPLHEESPRCIVTGRLRA